MSEIKPYIGFDPDKITSYFTGRNWPVTTIAMQETALVPVTRGAALECGDGRFDQLPDRKVHGVRVFGGVNAIMALLTGGDSVGLARATELIKEHGATPGTHTADNTAGKKGGCGWAELWMQGLLASAKYPYELNQEIGKEKVGAWLNRTLKKQGGKHFRLNGDHSEEAVRLNPFRGFTEAAHDGKRFRTDDWFLADLGVPDEVRFFKIAEAVEKLKSEAARLSRLRYIGNTPKLE